MEGARVGMLFNKDERDAAREAVRGEIIGEIEWRLIEESAEWNLVFGPAGMDTGLTSMKIHKTAAVRVAGSDDDWTRKYVASCGAYGVLHEEEYVENETRYLSDGTVEDVPDLGALSKTITIGIARLRSTAIADILLPIGEADR